MDEISVLKAEATAKGASWRETGERLIHCRRNDDGTFTFRNTTDAYKRGPIISEAQAVAYLSA